MWKYLKSAFWIRWKVPGLGRVPINVLALAIAAIFGIVVEPALLLLAIAGETLFLFSLASNKRFQQLVRGEELLAQDETVEARRRALVAQLDADQQLRLSSLDARAAKVIDLYRNLQADTFVIDATRDALSKLSWVYLKLLIARHYLLSQESQTNEQRLREQVAQLERDLASAQIPSSLRESKDATLKICRRRLENLERRELSMKEIDADLMRIEAQIELAVEDATMKGQPKAVSANIDFVTQLLDVGSYGSADEAVSDLEDRLSAPPIPAAQSARA